MQEVTDDTKAFLARLIPLGTTVTLNLGTTRLSPRARQAMDEAVAMRILTYRVQNSAMRVDARVDLSPYRRWMAKRTRDTSLNFPITEKIDEGFNNDPPASP